MSLEPGKQPGHYRLTERIGAGSMTHVTLILDWFSQLRRLVPR